MLKIFFCENRDDERASFVKIVQNVITIEQYDMSIEMETGNPHDILDFLMQNPNTIGAYFLDIDLESDMTGIELAEKIREYDPVGFIVFITALPEAVPLVFKYKVTPLDFINKSNFFDIRESVEACIRVIHRRLTQSAHEKFNILTVTCGGLLRIIELHKIISIESSFGVRHRYLTIITTEQRLEFTGYLKRIISKLDGRFFRIGQSCIINVQHVLSFNVITREITMRNGVTHIVPQRNVLLVRKLLSDWNVSY